MLGCVAVPEVWAQSLPESVQAGVVSKELSTAAPDVELEKYVPDIQVPEADSGTVKDYGPEFLVTGFEFEGNRDISDDCLNSLEVVLECVGKKVSVGRLQRLCVQLTEYCRTRGFLLARVYLPEQEISQGVVRICVREIDYDRMFVEGNRFYGSEFVLRYFEPLKQRSVDYNTLLRSLLLVNEYPALRVKSFFHKGHEPWTTQLVLDVEDSRPLTVWAEYNNHGSRYVSRDREKIGLLWSNAITDGDSVMFEGLWGMPLDAQMFYNLGYDIAVGGSGLKLGAGYSYSDFYVGDAFKDLDSTGDSHSGFFRASYPVIRTAAVSLDSLVRLDVSESTNYLMGQVSSQDRLRSLGFELNFNRVDAWHGRNYLNCGFEQGLGTFMDGSRSGQAGLSRKGAVTDFSKVTVFTARVQSLPRSMVLMLSANAQYCDDRLPAGEQFAVGGVDSVRGYYPSSCLGDSGIGVKTQLWFDLPFYADSTVPFMKKTWKDLLRFELFLDYGCVFLNAPLEGETRQRDILGTGIGVQAFLPYQIRLDLSVGFALDTKDCADVPQSVVYFKIFKEFF